jgi:hypothetical protein
LSSHLDHRRITRAGVDSLHWSSTIRNSSPP